MPEPFTQEHADECLYGEELSPRRRFGQAVAAIDAHAAADGPLVLRQAEVTGAVQKARAFRSRFTRFELPEAEHRLGSWLRSARPHPTGRPLRAYSPGAALTTPAAMAAARAVWSTVVWVA
ncbi:hypothetical protein [Streptomyces sp. NPDC005374]|uniref:hypothetical protein n=1 Tax=Streptomyces sp. NPDC005374 TaxID=3364713 RepID=UPI0036CAD394